MHFYFNIQFIKVTERPERRSPTKQPHPFIYLQKQSAACTPSLRLSQIHFITLPRLQKINKTNPILMYTGFKTNNSVNKTLASVDPTQTQLQTLQRQVDNYTRKLEQEKRKFFSIQDSLKNITEEYEKEKGKLNELKKENSKAHNVMLQAKVKNLEANLDKAISTYNDTVAHNNKLKNDIDMLRREKRNYTEMLTSLEEQIGKYETETQEKLILIDRKKKRAEELKEEIIEIKSKNQIERDQYIKQFDTLEKEYMNDKRDRQTLKFEKNNKPESIDTQPLLKHRLKKIVSSNKEKLKMIEQYKKHMKMIEQAFNDIKEKSGIHTLEEITNTFIKSEEQNYSLYNYMDELSRNIDGLEEENKELERKIEEANKLNEKKKEMLKNMTEEEKNKAELENYLARKEQSVRDLNDLVEKVRPILSETLLELSKSKFNDDPKKREDYELNMNINDRTIEEYLSDLEKYINTLMVIRHENKAKGVHNVKEMSTNYSKPLPVISYEELNKDKLDGREENRFIDETKFREYANEYWEKRKNKGKEI